jgi:acyl carrier protein
LRERNRHPRGRLSGGRVAREGNAMHEWVEKQVRAVVAERLGVGPEELTPETSLVDDLAADSLDILEIALGAEEALGIVIPDAVLDRLRTYGDLVAVASALLSRRDREPAAEQPPHVVARVWMPRETERRIERDVWLTPYCAETIAEDALGAGPGARLELLVPPDASDDDVARVRSRFTRLPPRGVEVTVRREPEAVPHPTAAA